MFCFLLHFAVSISLCFYNEEVEKCPNGSRQIQISNFAKFYEYNETELDIYLVDNLSSNEILDFKHLTHSNSIISISGIDDGIKTIYFSSKISFYSPSKYLTLNNIKVIAQSGTVFETPYIKLINSLIVYDDDTSPNLMSNEIYADTKSLSQIQTVDTKSLSIDVCDINNGSIYVGDIISYQTINIVHFNSKAYTFMFIGNSILIEDDNTKFEIMMGDFTLNLSIICSSSESTVILDHILERLSSNKHTINIFASNNTKIQFPDCNWSSTYTEVNVKRNGDAIIDLYNTDIPLEIEGSGKLTINLNGEKAAIVSLIMADNKDDNVLIFGNSNFEEQELLISKLFISSSPLISTSNNTLLINITTLYPETKNITLEGSAFYSFHENITSEISTISVENFIWDNDFTLTSLFSYDGFITLNILNEIRFSNSKNVIVIAPMQDMKSDVIDSLYGNIFTILKLPESFNINETTFKVDFESTFDSMICLSLENIFVYSILNNSVSIRIERNTSTVSNCFCVGKDEKCPANYVPIDLTESFLDFCTANTTKLIFEFYDDYTISIPDNFNNIETVSLIGKGDQLVNVYINSSLLQRSHFSSKNLFLNVIDLNSWSGLVGNHISLINTIFNNSSGNDEFPSSLQCNTCSIDLATYISTPINYSKLIFKNLSNPTIKIYKNGFSINNSDLYEVPTNSQVHFEFDTNENVEIIGESKESLINIYISSNTYCSFTINGDFPQNYYGIHFDTLKGDLFLNSENPPISLSTIADGSSIISGTSALYIYEDCDFRADIKLDQTSTKKSALFYVQNAKINGQNYLHVNGTLQIENTMFYDTPSVIHFPQLTIGKSFKFISPSWAYFDQLQVQEGAEIIIPFSFNDRTFIGINNFSEITPLILLKYEGDKNQNELKNYLSTNYTDILCSKTSLNCSSLNYSIIKSAESANSADMTIINDLELRCYQKTLSDFCISINLKSTPPYPIPTEPHTQVPTESPTQVPTSTPQNEKEGTSAILVGIASFLVILAIVCVVTFIRWIVKNSKTNRPDVIQIPFNAHDQLDIEVEDIQADTTTNNIEQSLLTHDS